MNNREPDFLHRKKFKFLLFLHLYNYFIYFFFIKTIKKYKLIKKKCKNYNKNQHKIIFFISSSFSGFYFNIRTEFLVILCIL